MRRVALLVRLALRGLRRETRRSLLTASAMALGLALLIFSRSIAEGAHEDWIDLGVRYAFGHVAVQAPGYLSSGSLDQRLSADQVTAAEAAIAELLQQGVIVESSTRLTVSGLASSAESAVPVQVMGVVPAAEGPLSHLAAKAVHGSYLDTEDRLGAYVGMALAERLGIDEGSRFVLTAQGADGEIQGQLVRVKGMFRTGLTELDEGLVHIPLETARDWLAAPGAATTIAAMTVGSEQVPAAVAALESRLRGSGARVLPWQESTPELYSMVRVDDYGDYIFHGLLFAIVALAILNAVLMSVLFRKREFGVLQALGLSPGETGTLVFIEGLFLTSVSGVVGIVAGFALTWLFFRDGLDLSFLFDQELTFSGLVFDPVMVPKFAVAHVVQSVGFIVAIGVAASIYPALHASHLDPAEAVKWEG